MGLDLLTLASWLLYSKNMGSSIFIRGKKTKSRFLNAQKPFFEHEIMQNAIWNMEKLKKV